MGENTCGVDAVEDLQYNLVSGGLRQVTWTKAELEAGRYGRRQEIPQQVLHIVRRAVSRIAGRGRVKWNSLRVDGLVVETKSRKRSSKRQQPARSPTPVDM